MPTASRLLNSEPTTYARLFIYTSATLSACPKIKTPPCTRASVYLTPCACAVSPRDPSEGRTAHLRPVGAISMIFYRSIKFI